MTGKRYENRVSPQVVLHSYYATEFRAWYGFYADNDGNQIGDAWHQFSRDDVLIHRPPTPTT